MKCAYADSTFKNLHIQWETFLMFCYYYKLEPLPVDVETLCLYGQFLNRAFRSIQSIKVICLVLKHYTPCQPWTILLQIYSS